MKTLLFLLVHGLALTTSLKLGGWLAGEVLVDLRLVNPDDRERPGAARAGRTIGYAERFFAYVAVLADLPELLAVLLALKTIVRYPEVQQAARDGSGPSAGAGRFAEYYLVGTLVSLAVGVACPLAAKGLLWWLGMTW